MRAFPSWKCHLARQLSSRSKRNVYWGGVNRSSSSGHRVGNFVRIAYNGVADLQIQIREIGVDVTKLCDKSAVTVSKFKQASGSILGDLQGTYQFLLDGLEDVALETLHAVTDARVEAALKETIKTKGSETERKKSLEESAKKLEVDKARAAQEKKAAEEDFEHYEEKYRAAEKKQESLETSTSNPGKAIGNALISPFTRGRKLFDTDSDVRRAQEAREEKLMHLEEMKKQRHARSNALQDIAEFAKKIENCKDDSELAEVAINVLHSAMGGLQKLSAIMMKAALFWKQMQVHCEQLAKDKMQRMITSVMKKSEEQRLKVWTSNGFKTQAINYYAQWVALDDVCTIYMGRIQETQKDLYGYLTENPTLKEARKKVRELAITFGKELEMEQKAIAEKEFAAEMEIKHLKSESGEE